MATTSRRQFMTRSALGLAGLTCAPQLSAAISANGQVNIGLVGCGWRGGQLLQAFQGIPGVVVLGLCDPDQARMEEAAKSAPEAERHADMRKLLENENIDAVVIANCNHWHCLSAIWALQAGKHVYVEKPLFHNRWEGLQLMRAVADHGKICQVGTQQRSDPMQTEIKQFLHEDAAIGKPTYVRVNRFGVRPPIGKLSEPLRIPESVNYDLWVGPANDQPIFRKELHYDWHWDWNTGSGEMGNWGVHIIDDVRNNVFQDQIETPSRVAAIGGRYVWGDAGNTPNLQLAVLDAGGVPVSISLCNLTAGEDSEGSPEHIGPGSGYTVYCEGGRFEGERGKGVAYDNDGKVIRRFRGDSGQGHHVNFIECLRQGDPSGLNAPVEAGFYSTGWCDMANVATRVTDSLGDSSQQTAEELLSLAGVEEELQRLKGVLTNHGLDDAASKFQLGPILGFDQSQEQYVDQHAATANQFLRREGRGDYRVPAGSV